MADSLLMMKNESLKFSYTLLHDSNVLKMLIPFTREKINKSSQSEIMEMINREAHKYRYTSNSNLQKMLLGELEALYKIPRSNLYTKQDVADQCDRVINAMYYDLKKNNKKFAAFVTDDNTTKLEQIMEFQMVKLVDSINEEKATDEQLSQIGDLTDEFVKGLPKHQQNQIAEKLGINKFTNNTMRQLIATNGITVVFSAIVQVTGFAFYTTLTSIVAGIFGLIGLTLPFAVYATLTSTVAVIANPLFFIPALLIGGNQVLKWQDNKIKKTIAPIVLMQIMLEANSVGEPDWEAFLDG